MKNDPFAKKCGVSEGVIRKILRGEGAKDLILEKIAAANGKQLSWFYKDVEDTSHNKNIDVWGDKTEIKQIKGNLDPSIKAELMRQTSEILDSNTIYRSAIIPNIRSFHHGVMEEKKMGTLEKDIREMRKMMEQILNENKDMMERLGIIEDEKKRAGNDL